MIPVTVEALLVGQVPGKSVIILRPYMETGPNPRVLPIYVGMPEAMALSTAIENRQNRRPQTHDLTMAILEELGGKFVRTIIDRVDGMTFYARIVIEQEDDVIEIDARPSDAIAMAIHADAPIYVEAPVFTAAAIVFDSSRNEIEEREVEAFRNYVDSLSPEDFTSTNGGDA